MQLHHERTEERRKLVKGKQDTESSATNIHEKWKKILGTVYILGGYLQGYVYINFHELSQYGWAMMPGFVMNFASIKSRNN